LARREVSLGFEGGSEGAVISLLGESGGDLAGVLSQLTVVWVAVRPAAPPVPIGLPPGLLGVLGLTCVWTCSSLQVTCMSEAEDGAELIQFLSVQEGISLLFFQLVLVPSSSHPYFLADSVREAFPDCPIVNHTLLSSVPLPMVYSYCSGITF
jgi:hypothetical protein